MGGGDRQELDYGSMRGFLYPYPNPYALIPMLCSQSLYLMTFFPCLLTPLPPSL